ncbi:uncharacterized protein LOC127806328 [Diospyros lotus]|uniref:uncharacterized protein LOC127806328 n=1 Tax=Diospyros lotus TaxID=55363 RepID=UPI002251E3A6|nr:uncharacterized protein LOC127806328 [Diospyros lotus]
MPRPGPRPYECVRRAWHSDRHQPVRGSIIQQIFRVVHESHSAATKKNREWREKLPIVVLKAEEIMYSKANSEAEYVDLETLWDRVNDAINTIIRRDESTETGDLLPPCVEAALNLGCIPVRASRSQRNSNPTGYLSPRTQEPDCVPAKVLDGTSSERKPLSLPIHPGNELTTARPLVMNSVPLVTVSDRHAMQNDIYNNASTSSNIPFPCGELAPPHNNQFVPTDSNPSVHCGSVFPLYYGSHSQPNISHFDFQLPRNSNSRIVGTPVLPSTVDPAKMGSLQNLFSSEREEHSKNIIKQRDIRSNHDKVSETGFDLSLRLGLFKDSSMSLEKVSAHDGNIVDLNNSQEGSKFSDISHCQNEEFSFFPVHTGNDPSGFQSTCWNFGGEGQSTEGAVRKRKAPLNHNLEDELFASHPEFRFNQFTGRDKRPVIDVV